ncbi:MAG: phosphoribosyltransferase family protein, partial [bacterium]|nr:phosphoribosyltransferase family protein [bacterium]
VLVDDGIATGATTLAAISWIKSQNPGRVILAVPVAPADTVEKLKPQVDELVCLQVEMEFWAVGRFYREFAQVADEEVRRLLDEK